LIQKSRHNFSEPLRATSLPPLLKGDLAETLTISLTAAISYLISYLLRLLCNRFDLSP
jgi:hypothetical protein